MRLAPGLLRGLLLVAVLGFAACSDGKVEQARAAFGCAPVQGLTQVTGRNQPRYIIVGEFTETNEAPAAFAEIACNLAASDKLFVGVSEYLGGATDAETRMRQRLDALTARGAPIIVAVISDQNREWNPHNRAATEKHWAEDIVAKVAASGATHALLLVSHTDARDSAYPRGERFAGYDPMPMHLPEGQVMSLEIGAAPDGRLAAPAVRLYPKMTEGFHGQVALASLTRPAVALQLSGVSKAGAGGTAANSSFGQLFDDKRQRVLSVILPSKQNDATSNHLNTEVALEIPEPLVDLPDFELETPAPN